MDGYTTDNVSLFHSKKYKQKWHFYCSLEMDELFVNKDKNELKYKTQFMLDFM